SVELTRFAAVAGGAPFPQSSIPFPHGTRRTARPAPVLERNAAARISPRSLMQQAANICRLKFAGRSLFKSTMGPPFSHRNPVKALLSHHELPTICDFEFMLRPTLPLELHVGKAVPRSVILPFFQRNACCMVPSGLSALPTTSPTSLS